ncbi:MAG: hypothetical protein ABI278_08805 [Candidatus Aquilonibacter sp.]
MPDSPKHESLRPSHPLALELIERMRERRGAHILEVGRGSGRNLRALESAGFHVVDFSGSFGGLCAGALSTHALLHGTSTEIALLLEQVAGRIERGAPFFCTFGSARDARFGQGTRIDAQTFAPVDGDEAGVAHTFFSESQLREVLRDRWIVESLVEGNADNIAGRWAHGKKPLERSVHYFAKLQRH